MASVCKLSESADKLIDLATYLRPDGKIKVVTSFADYTVRFKSDCELY